MPQIAIEPATLQTLSDWVRLRTELWPHGSRDEHERDAMQLLERASDMTCLVARVDGLDVVGFAEVALRRDYVAGCTTSPVAFLEGIFVATGFRRQGIARLLCAEAEVWAREQGCREFASDASIDNLDSHRMHAALDFQEVERVVAFRKVL
jgi:aminoglycoside 6'-N-acetyltransferase I